MSAQPRDDHSIVLDAHPAIRLEYSALERKACGAEVNSVVEKWITYLLINLGLSKGGTIPVYIKRLAGYLAWLKHEGIDYRSATRADIIRWQQWLYLEKSWAAGTRKVHTVAVRRFYDWLLEENSPAARIPTPKWVAPLPRKYNRDQLRKLFATCDPTSPYGLRDLALLLFFYATGARCMEVCGLSLEQVALRNRTGSVQFYGKGSKERLVSIEGPVVDVLRRWLLRREQIACADSAVFVSISSGRHGKGVRITNRAIEKILKRRARQAKLRSWGIHRFRVTFATDLYDDGVGLETIRTLLGHNSIETTRRYIQISESKLRTRMSGQRQRQALSPRQNDLPLWLQKQLGQLADENTNDH